MITLLCSYYYCRSCKTSQQPWDTALGLTKRRVTPAAEEAITLAGLLTIFGQAARQTLIKLTGIRISESTVRRVTEDAGEELQTALAEKQTFGPAKNLGLATRCAGPRLSRRAGTRASIMSACRSKGSGARRRMVAWPR